MKALLVATSLMFPIAAQAQISTDMVQPTKRIPPDAVLSAVTIDFNSDGAFDRAVLVESDDRADLYLYLSQNGPDPDKHRTLALFKRGAAWTGAMWGTLPTLEVSAKGSLLLKSGNDAIGRSRWQQTLTVVYREDKFVVAGVTFSSRDTSDSSSDLSCDFNLLTGYGTRNGKRTTTKFKAAALDDWKDDQLPKECR